MNVVSFTKVALPFGWLGNMSRHPVVHEGTTWRTAEALFQAMRFVDPDIRRKIYEETSPMTAKAVAKQNIEAMSVVPQSEDDLRNMRVVLRLKIEQHPNLAQALLDTADATIVEDVTSRASKGSAMFWGAALRENGTWEGENTLGKLWMELRGELRERMAFTPPTAPRAVSQE